MSRPERRVEFEETNLVIVDTGEGDYSQCTIEELKRANLGISMISLNLSQEAASGENKENALSKINEAGIIIGPWDIVITDQEKGLIAPDMASAVVNSPAVKLLAPTRSEGWEWAGVEQWNTEFFVRQTLNAVKQIIENKGVKPVQPLGVGAIIGIVIGIIFLLLLLGIPISYFFEYYF
jgi:hypothetical protein